MYIIEITYKTDLAEVDKWISPHIEWLETHYANGVFIASGRKIPRTGGIILATVQERQTLDAIIAQDPFYLANVANYKVTEFEISKAADTFAQLVGK